MRRTALVGVGQLGSGRDFHWPLGTEYYFTVRLVPLLRRGTRMRSHIGPYSVSRLPQNDSILWLGR